MIPGSLFSKTKHEQHAPDSVDISLGSNVNDESGVTELFVLWPKEIELSGKEQGLNIKIYIMFFFIRYLFMIYGKNIRKIKIVIVIIL